MIILYTHLLHTYTAILQNNKFTALYNNTKQRTNTRANTSMQIKEYLLVKIRICPLPVHAFSCFLLSHKVGNKMMQIVLIINMFNQNIFSDSVIAHWGTVFNEEYQHTEIQAWHGLDTEWHQWHFGLQWGGWERVNDLNKFIISIKSSSKVVYWVWTILLAHI